MSRAGEWIVATLEERPRATRQTGGGSPTVRRDRAPSRSPHRPASRDVSTTRRASDERAGEDDESVLPGSFAPEPTITRKRYGRQSDVLWWAVGGAVLVGVVVLVLALGASPDGAASAMRNGLDAGIAEVSEMIAGGDAAGAAARLAELRQSGSLSGEQSAAVQALDGCLWLSTQAQDVVAASFREDLERLTLLWDEAQADGLAATDAACPIPGGVQAAVAASAMARQAYLQAVLDQGGLEAWRGVAGTLDGLNLNGLDGLLPESATFAVAGARAQAALASHWLATGDCEQAGQALDALTALTDGNAILTAAVSLQELVARREACADVQARCAALAGIGAVDSTRLGEEMRALADTAPDGVLESGACPEVAVGELFAARVEALRALALQEDPAEAVLAATQIVDHPWFEVPPIGTEASPAEIVAGAYALLLATRCGDQPCSDGVPATTQAEAEAFYAAHRTALGPQALVSLVGALRRVGSTCAPCGLTEPLEASSLDLLDPGLGEWTVHGMYPSGTGRDLAWHLNDVFVKRERGPAYQAPVEEDGTPQPLYETGYVPFEGESRSVALRIRAQMISLKGAVKGWRALWGVQVPGTDAEPALLIVLWDPEEAPGRWGLFQWQPGTGERHVVLLPAGSLDQMVELRIERGLDGASYEVYWQGELALVGEETAGMTPCAVRFLVGEGSHAWIRSAAADVVR